MRVLSIFGLILISLVALVEMTLWTPDTDADEMRAKYGEPPSEYVDAAGMQVHYRVSGPEDAPALILVHGTSASLHTWEPLRALLDDRFRVIAYDQPGHGLTGPHPERDYSYQGMADALDAIYAAEGLESAVLVGNSMGGWISWRDALANPDRVDALVLIDAFAFPETVARDTTLAFKIMSTRFGSALALKITPRPIVKKSVYQSIARQEVITPAMVDRYWELTRFPGNRQAMRDQFSLVREDLSGRLGEIEKPTLVLWGDKDNLIPLAAGERLAAAIPGAEFIVYDNVGHLPMEEVPGDVARDIEAFLDASF